MLHQDEKRKRESRKQKMSKQMSVSPQLKKKEEKTFFF